MTRTRTAPAKLAAVDLQQYVRSVTSAPAQSSLHTPFSQPSPSGGPREDSHSHSSSEVGSCVVDQACLHRL